MNLPTLAPNATRSVRVQSNCHQRLAQQRKMRERRELVAIRIERTLVTGLAVIYLAAVTANVLSVFAVF